jgi:alpha-L-rhamnosidase
MTRSFHTRFLRTFFLVTALGVPMAVNAQESAKAPHELRVESKVEPLGLDTQTPRFSWELDDARRGAQQSAYQVVVSENVALLTSEKPDTWDSGRTLGRDTNQVAYSGRELLPWRKYNWAVRTWDVEGKPSPWSAPSSFTMGPMRPGDWRGKWIGTAKTATSANPGEFLGYHSAYSKAADDFKFLQIDFGTVAVFDSIRLHPVHLDGDETKPGFLFPVRVKVYVDDSPNFDHTFMKAGEYTWQDIPASEQPLQIKFTRYKVRFVRVVIEKMAPEADKGFAFALSEFEVLDGENNVAPLGMLTVSDSLEEGGWSKSALIDGVRSSGKTGKKAPQAAAGPAPMLRKEFDVAEKPARALLAATALGVYDVWINGQRVGDQRLAPGWTDYTKRVPYQMYDVTSLVREGKNAIGVMIGDGWYAGKIGLTMIVPGGPSRGIYGSDPLFLAQLQVDAAGGGKTTVVATDDTWRWSPEGPVRTSDLLDGEKYDASKEVRGWDMPGLVDTEWRKVTVAESGPPVFAQVAEPIRELTEIAAKSVASPKPGVFVYDFGQNISGVVRLRYKVSELLDLTLRHGEVLDLVDELQNYDSLYTANLRGAAQTDHVRLRPGGGDAWDPSFTVHGFRFVEITGSKTALPLEAVSAVPITSGVREVGSFECSDKMLTQLWKNIEWTRRDDMVGLPTDCPQRDERLGWMGDILSFAQTAMFQADMSSFLAQWLGEVRSAQTKAGRFPDFAPHPYKPEERFSGAPGWGDAGVFVPWEMYLHYHDRDLLRASVDSMIRWVDLIHSKNPGLVWKDKRENDYGDWLNADTIQGDAAVRGGNEVPKDVFATMFFARSTEIAAKAAFAAERINDSERLSKLAHEIREAFRKAFVDENGRIQGDTQAGYALAIDFGLFEDKNQEAQAVAHLVRKIDAAGGALTTGFHSTHRAMLALSRHGRHDLALAIARRDTLPSWGYEIANGATTLWERWDGFVKGRGFQSPDMNSFNHYAFGSVGEWMVRTIGGLELEDGYPAFGTVTLFPTPNGKTRSSAEGPRAFEHVTLRPEIAGGLTWAKVKHHSIAGEFAIAWKLDGDVLTYECTIPANTSATLHLPAKDKDSITEGGEPLAKVKGLQFWRMTGDRAEIEVPAGTYRFVSKLR